MNQHQYNLMMQQLGNNEGIDMNDDDDYQYGDEWDWDKNDSSQYCKHGTFIGSWWGPDILCGRCEMGD